MELGYVYFSPRDSNSVPEELSDSLKHIQHFDEANGTIVTVWHEDALRKLTREAILNRLGHSVDVRISAKERASEKTHIRVLVA